MAKTSKPSLDTQSKHLKDPGPKASSSSRDSDIVIERFRWSFEDPMHNYLKEQAKKEKLDRVKELQMLLDADTSSDSSDSSSDSCGKRKHKRDTKERKRHKSAKRMKLDKKDCERSDSKQRKRSKDKHKRWKETSPHKRKKPKHNC